MKQAFLNDKEMSKREKESWKIEFPEVNMLVRDGA